MFCFALHNESCGAFSSQWGQLTGSICQQSVLVCGFDVGPQNNWLITQHISRNLSDGQLLDYVSVQVEYELNGCDVSRQCRQSFDVYRWDTSDINLAPARDISNYMFVERISPEDTSGTARVNATLTIDLTSVIETGLYLALVDLSTCIIVHRLLVFYYVCPAETSNLITRPETIAPESAIPGQCAENSSPTISDQPLVSCTDMGTWDTIIGCACDPGFQGVTASSCSGIAIHMCIKTNPWLAVSSFLHPRNHLVSLHLYLVFHVPSCSECPAGTYSDSISNSPCQSCPDNSEATQTGLSECPCVQNYYRAPDEGAGEACTRELCILVYIQCGNSCFALRYGIEKLWDFPHACQQYDCFFDKDLCHVSVGHDASLPCTHTYCLHKNWLWIP